MDLYPTKQDTHDAFIALHDAQQALLRAQRALRVEPFALEKLDDALASVRIARQVASVADDHHKGRLTDA